MLGSHVVGPRQRLAATRVGAIAKLGHRKQMDCCGVGLSFSLATAKLRHCEVEPRELGPHK